VQVYLFRLCGEQRTREFIEVQDLLQSDPAASIEFRITFGWAWPRRRTRNVKNMIQ
jgi:hypothetical protein